MSDMKIPEIKPSSSSDRTRTSPSSGPPPWLRPQQSAQEKKAERDEQPEPLRVPDDDQRLGRYKALRKWRGECDQPRAPWDPDDAGRYLAFKEAGALLRDKRPYFGSESVSLEFNMQYKNCQALRDGISEKILDIWKTNEETKRLDEDFRNAKRRMHEISEHTGSVDIDKLEKDLKDIQRRLNGML